MSAGVDHQPLREDTPRTYYEEVVKIPGFGEPPNRCRPMTPVGFCEHGHVVLGRSSCRTRYCPDHWRDWNEEAVINMVARLAAYREAQDGRGKRLCHVVASPPQDRRYSVRELWETRTDAYEALQAAGVRGAAVVTHPYRTNEIGDDMFRTAKTSGELDEDTGRWKFLRDLAGDDWNELAEYVEASPHYHTLAAVEDVDVSDVPEGWVVENIRSFQGFHYKDTECYRDMAQTAYYVLTHGAVMDGRSTTTYFGDVHPNSFKPEEELTAVRWNEIQRQAENAVKEYAEEDDDGDGCGHKECPHDDCEAVVRELVYLPEYLDDDEWKAEIRAMREGRKRLAQLRGTVAFWESRTDRPPPSALTSEKRMLRWLRERGEMFTPEPSQSRLAGPSVSFS